MERRLLVCGSSTIICPCRKFRRGLLYLNMSKEQYELKQSEKEEKRKKEAWSRMIERLVFGAIIFLVIAGFVFLAIKYKGSSPEQPVLGMNAVSASDWTKGDKNAKIILIEYSDFQCPACVAYEPTVKQITDEFKDRIVFVYRHFPLSQHKNAESAAMASEAAGRQGKFWEIHDLIFENQKEWSEALNAEDIFAGYAQKIGLDINRFKDDLNLKESKDKISGDSRSGLEAGVNATPTFFLNGRKISPRSYEEFKNAISQAINNP
ncbi:MAG: Na+/H+ antiporter, NhaA family protein, nonfunctional [Candidatus Wolfebacteria bacterium GW2011_GWA1_44_24]|uniref:Na+/H+ antiporter, NhaA family protein, nonfunctional n=1 Tax=Candidatus Wolfebacteria bacterium GW2011_GWB1_41_12 TaxID=1619006 RepID=A0A0G0UJ57_9BACT|nr:MAG: Na+/H+ antiporter, NhaA family protein, nonfunctional [Candidatus Wolfebacteria bacterium GW2011_GWB1_41_12]KKT56547.1 MAG: Na+/H+ antiporter, NhaA family protein, nonfunctional [Candidatus Wolfebacteria bacterium GW2011_GWA1_44_24]